MSKKEVYYEFMFPNYKNLSQPTVDPDKSRQCGQVKDLCDSCPERVITYDMLSSLSLSEPYTESDWSSSKKKAIKSYIDQYLKIPKYFNLRNYWDADPCQSGGMSLMVSYSPEVGVVPIWTKFKASDGKTIYCSLIVSSGDFFYGWNLPDDVLAKSGLRDVLVRDRFHSNWYYRTGIDTVASGAAQFTGQEKRVFIQYYFAGNVNYGINIKNYFIYYTKTDGTYIKVSKDTKDDTDTIFEIDYYTNKTIKKCSDNPAAEVLTPYTDSYGNSCFMTEPTNSQYFHISGNTNEKAIRYRYDSSSIESALKDPEDAAKGYNYYVKGSNKSIRLDLHRTPETYDFLSEDLKKDYIDLEVTRRILYCSDTQGYLDYNGKAVPIASSITGIPKVMSGIGKSTVLSYEPPQEYIKNPPLQIPYDKLRYALNDRPPFSDCETVLVMWVADDDPSGIEDGDVSGLHNLNWQQYAIPISVRCCFKGAETNNDKYCHDRFLVSYPYITKNVALDPATKLPLDNSKFRFHYRHNEAYDKNVFRESLFLQDLIDYSKDYIVSYLNTEYYNVGFDVQRFLFGNIKSSFRQLYTRNSTKNIWQTINGVRTLIIGWNTNTQQQQANYVSVNSSHFKINTSNNTFKTCLESAVSSNTEFKPSTVIKRSDYEKWDYPADNYFYINDNCIIAMFDANDSKVKSVTGTLKLKDQSDVDDDFTLSSLLGNDIYLSSLGLLGHKWIDNDSFIYGSSLGAYPLNVLDNHLMINDTLYGSKSNNKVIVGLKQAYDYTNSDCLHFTKNNNIYELQEVDRSIRYTVYYMDYTS